MTKGTTRKVVKPPSTPSSSKFPAPFQAVPSDLSPLIALLNKDNVYISHIDRLPARFKKQIFIIPVLLNFAILAGLLWRIYFVAPWYWSLLVIFSRGPGALEKNLTKEMSITILRRLVSFVIDYVLITIIWKWPISFFLERPESPMSWRGRVGFRDEEVIVRVSRNWGGKDLMGGVSKGGESPFFKTRVLPALASEKMQKTGYLLMDGSWDLDFKVMVAATRLCDKKELNEEQLDRKILTWIGGEEDGQWVIWDEKTFGQETSEKVLRMEEDSNTENREKIHLIQHKMREMGKEDLFFKWVELIQFESTRPGGFTVERQMEASLKVRALFEEHGLDLEEFEKSVGGINNQTEAPAS